MNNIIKWMIGDKPEGDSIQIQYDLVDDPNDLTHISAMDLLPDTFASHNLLMNNTLNLSRVIIKKKNHFKK